ncbi:MAG: hypothetical protein ISS32_00840 [Candidatus Omnitrophica bacterium]|nr:hypothetical protein [Candidatus Omnitrophota bacterium]MBL7151729.1 hypothetical protein [Candidatus Omnitrophota bacterium]MBL7210313.1 hypothetical protein [Candidatus Omnitrophota bacterium]
MVRTVDFEKRKNAVLSATINRHIHEATPVASEEIASEFDLSSATIRNIFAELEEGGLLTHPYTSGGRVPTQKGYRYYVDYLIQEMQLLDEQKQDIVREYKKEIRQLEEALERTTEVISTITHYAGIVSFLEWQDKFFYRGLSRILEQPEFRDSGRIRLLVRMIEEKQRLLDIINRDFTDEVRVYIGSELGLPEMANCSLVVSSYRRKKRFSGRLAVLGPVRMEYRRIIPAVEYISCVLSEILDKI